MKKGSGSGEHAAVRAYRKKLDSIDEAADALVRGLHKRLDDVLERSSVRPAKDEEEEIDIPLSWSAEEPDGA